MSRPSRCQTPAARLGSWGGKARPLVHRRAIVASGRRSRPWRQTSLPGDRRQPYCTSPRLHYVAPLPRDHDVSAPFADLGLTIIARRWRRWSTIPRRVERLASRAGRAATSPPSGGCRSAPWRSPCRLPASRRSRRCTRTPRLRDSGDRADLLRSFATVGHVVNYSYSCTAPEWSAVGAITSPIGRYRPKPFSAASAHSPAGTHRRPRRGRGGDLRGVDTPRRDWRREYAGWARALPSLSNATVRPRCAPRRRRDRRGTRRDVGIRRLLGHDFDAKRRGARPPASRALRTLSTRGRVDATAPGRAAARPSHPTSPARLPLDGPFRAHSRPAGADEAPRRGVEGLPGARGPRSAPPRCFTALAMRQVQTGSGTCSSHRSAAFTPPRPIAALARDAPGRALSLAASRPPLHAS